MHSLRKHLTAQHAAHAVMLSFAVASLANVESFFAHLHPGLPALSWGLGIALGLGLVVMAGLLSGMVADLNDSRFRVVLTVTTGLALLSGGIQAAAYAAHMKSALAAVVVGMALPCIGELGVALAVSAYNQAQRRQRMNNAQDQLADGVRSQIGDAIANIDKSKIEAQVNRAASVVTRMVVDSTVNSMIAEMSRDMKVDHAAVQPADVTPAPFNIESPAPIVNTVDPSHAPSCNGELTPELTPDLTPTVNFADRMAKAKTAKAVRRQQELLSILMTEFNGQPSDMLNKTELGERLGATRQTIGKDIEQLIAQRRLAVNGHVEVL